MTERRAFTLLEMLVVIAIIVLLLTILAPSLQEMLRQTRTALCGNNLKRIGEVVRGQMYQDPNVAELTPQGWPQKVSDYVGTNEILLCPEADEVPEGVTGLEPLNKYIRIAYDNSSRTIEFVESGIMCKASQTQFSNFDGNMKQVWASGQRYIDDGSEIIYWGYEDQGAGGDDYQDVLVKVSMTSGGLMEVDCTSETSGHPVIQDVNTGQILVTREEFNYHASPRGWKTKTINLKTNGEAGGSNYALNAHNVGKYKVGKILALDYVWTIARSTDEWTGADFDADRNRRPDFARHSGRVNVLFSGSSVQLMRPDDIDPATARIEEDCWLP